MDKNKYVQIDGEYVSATEYAEKTIDRFDKYFEDLHNTLSEVHEENLIPPLNENVTVHKRDLSNVINKASGKTIASAIAASKDVTR